MSNFTIGKLAKSASVGVETIRFYERKGLIKRPPKSSSGFRHYAPENSRRILFIKRAQELGYTLREIKELIELDANRQTTCVDYIASVERKLDEIDRKIQDLKRMKRALQDILTSCEDDSCDAECNPLYCFETGCEVQNLDEQKVKK